MVLDAKTKAGFSFSIKAPCDVECKEADYQAVLANQSISLKASARKTWSDVEVLAEEAKV